jgi:hypothetical protein
MYSMVFPISVVRLYNSPALPLYNSSTFLPRLIVIRTTPLLSLTSFISILSFMPKLLKNILPTFNIIIWVDLDNFKAFLNAFLVFLIVIIALYTLAALILAYALAY